MNILRGPMLLLLACTAAFAAPITWTINATLDDGATVTGSFVFNPDLGGSQTLTNFNIQISAATPGTLSEPFDNGLPTSVFFAFDFTPANSLAISPSGTGGSFNFASNASFANPLPGLPSESLVLQFALLAPLTDASSTIITNSDINLNDGHSNECFDCEPYVCFAGASSALCAGSSVSTTPEPQAAPLLALGICCLICAVTVGRRRARLRRTHPSATGNNLAHRC